MAAVDDVDELIEQYFRAQGEFLRGNPQPVKALFSHREDVTLANPHGPPVRGFDEVAKNSAREEITPLAVRATMNFRPEEDGEWKIVHRHADPITTPQPAESVIQELLQPSRTSENSVFRSSQNFPSTHSGE